MTWVCESCWRETDELFEDEDGNAVCEDCLCDNRLEFVPDDDHGITIGEAVKDVAVFLAQVLVVLITVALVFSAAAYALWREFTIMSWFVNQ